MWQGQRRFSTTAHVTVVRIRENGCEVPVQWVVMLNRKEHWLLLTRKRVSVPSGGSGEHRVREALSRGKVGNGFPWQSRTLSHRGAGLRMSKAVTQFCRKWRQTPREEVTEHIHSRLDFALNDLLWETMEQAPVIPLVFFKCLFSIKEMIKRKHLYLLIKESTHFLNPKHENRGPFCVFIRVWVWHCNDV